MFEKVKRYYDTGLWSKERVQNVMYKGVITYDEYVAIVGDENDAE